VNITINTDASFCPHHKVGGYAFWIVCNNGRLKMSGELKSVNNSLDAETQALANAVYALRNSNLITGKVDFIYINSDCKQMFVRIGKNNRDEVGRFIAKNLSYILKKGKMPYHGNNKRYDLRHVKAHTHTKTKRNWVNNWCDVEAKKHMQAQRNKIKQNKFG